MSENAATEPEDDTPTLLPLPGGASASTTPYRVLARTYRPQRLSELIGQDVLVRSLENAIRTGRVAQAFLLTGIRGVGKTTTARIIARALNCTGADGRGDPTPEPCGSCDACVAIAEDRHIDVLEMDAATRTGIDDIREIVDSVRYAPTSARYKIYIIDEVHMLSEKAFNGLLKTLEEPPPRAKFIFATTEVRKVPVTILSRCQRFDLRRIEPGLLVSHLERIAAREQVTAEAAALQLIARAAEGSVRDALSLLDQAIALRGGAGAPIAADEVQAMLGLADRTRVLDLFELVQRGAIVESLDQLADLHGLGCEPSTLLQDLLDICHGLTRLKLAPDATSPLPLGLPESEADRCRSLADGLSIPVLSRTWQMLLKGLDELKLAPDTERAAEMLLIRIAHVADLPPPAALARLVSEGGGPAPAAGGDPPAPAEREPRGVIASAAAEPEPERSSPAPEPTTDPGPASPADFASVVELFRRHGEPMLFGWLHGQARLVDFAPGRIEIQANGHTSSDWPRRVADCLSRWTDRTWQVHIRECDGAPSLAEQDAAAKRTKIDALSRDQRLQPLFERFPGARIVDVRPRTGSGPALPSEET